VHARPGGWGQCVAGHISSTIVPHAQPGTFLGYPLMRGRWSAILGQLLHDLSTWERFECRSSPWGGVSCRAPRPTPSSCLLRLNGSEGCSAPGALLGQVPEGAQVWACNPGGWEISASEQGLREAPKSQIGWLTHTCSGHRFECSQPPASSNEIQSPHPQHESVLPSTQAWAHIPDYLIQLQMQVNASPITGGGGSAF